MEKKTMDSEQPTTPEWVQPRTYEWEEQQLKEQTQTLNKMSAEYIAAQDRAGWKVAEEHRKEVIYLLDQNKLLRQMLEKKAQEHIHGPFTFLLNANHNALRGCQTCGTAWVGSMMSSEDNLAWHLVQEEEDE